ncbi:MAG: DMT family transporter [Ligilactobacillus salivarius]
MISFTVGALLLIIIVLILPVQISNLKLAYQDFSKQWWLWIGGFFRCHIRFSDRWGVTPLTLVRGYKP